MDRIDIPSLRLNPQGEVLVLHRFSHLPHAQVAPGCPQGTMLRGAMSPLRMVLRRMLQALGCAAGRQTRYCPDHQLTRRHKSSLRNQYSVECRPNCGNGQVDGKLSRPSVEVVARMGFDWKQHGVTSVLSGCAQSAHSRPQGSCGRLQAGPSERQRSSPLG